jgi:5-hydroxyisourate hydrolase-like protein (transthyretin family)
MNRVWKYRVLWYWEASSDAPCTPGLSDNGKWKSHMMKNFVLLLASVCSGAPAGMISGTVLDRVTEKPVRRAVVTLATTEARPQEAVAWTDTEGRFAFGYLPEGRYRLSAYKMGYQMAAYGSDTTNRRGSILVLAAGENKAGLTIKIAAASAITGTVVDDEGDPIMGAHVSIYSNVRQRGTQTLQPANSAMTDSHGQYRIANVFPGEYLLAVNSDGEVMKGRAEVSAGEPQQQHFVFEPQFYPAASDPKAATKLKLASGQDLEGVNFRLQAVPMAILRGRVIVPAGVDVGNGLQVSVTQNFWGRRQMRGGFAPAPDFAFQIPGLRPGIYRLIAQASVQGKEYRGAQQVQLGHENDVSVTLEPAVELSGSVKIEGPGAEKFTIDNVALTPGDELPMGRPVRARVDKDGTFKLPAVLPGIWDISATPVPPGGYIKSMRLGDQDVLTEEMTITSSTTAPLRIVVSTAGAVVEGTVEGGEQGARYMVVLVPTGRYENVDSFRRTATTDEKLHFEMKGITPGAYKLYALTQAPGRGVLDFKPFEAEAVSVELKEGQRVSEKLKLITPGGQNQ